MKHKSFIDIEHANADNIGEFKPGDEIIIQEKIDGTNAAIRFDRETKSVVAQSRKNILNCDDNLRGFFEWAQRLDAAAIEAALGDTYILFGEWLVPHTVIYPEERYDQFYAYDIYSLTGNTYLPQHIVRATAQELGINYAPVFYEGEFTSWDDCKQYVGRTGLGGEYGEGIVVKNQTLVTIATMRAYHCVPSYRDLFNDDWMNGRNRGYIPREPFYLKIVGEKFKETKPIKKKKQLSPEDQAAYDEAVAKTESIVTPARTEKILHKLVDEGILPEKWQAKDLKTVAQNLPKRMFEDCLKEEKALATSIPQFSKLCNKVCMQHARDILNKRTIL